MNGLTPQAILIGINEPLEGNENNIISCFPFIKCPDKSALAGVIELEWDCSTGKGLGWIADDYDISEEGTFILNDDGPIIQIANTQIVALIGPLFLKNISILFGGHHLSDVLSTKLFDIQMGYLVSCLTMKQYSYACARLFDDAIKLFDSEIRKSLDHITDRARVALDVFDGIGLFASEEDRYIRIAAAAEIDQDWAARDDYLEYAALDLGQPIEYFETRLQRYRGRINPSIIITTGESEKSVGEVHEAGLLDTIQLPATLPIHLRKMYTHIRTAIATEEVLLSVLDGMAHTLTNPYTNLDFPHLWMNLVNAFHPNGSSNVKQRLMYFLRSYTLQTSRAQWAPEGSQLIPSELYEMAQVLDKATHFNDFIKDNTQINELIFGHSQFHEDTILGHLFQKTMRQLDGDVVRIRVEPIVYGTGVTANGDPADLSIVNELIEDPSSITTQGIFLHKGYYGFIRRETLERLISSEIPDEVKCVIEDDLLVQTPEQLLEYPSSMNRENTATRCWIALKGGLRSYKNSEYHKLYDSMHNMAKQQFKNGLPNKPFQCKSDDFDADLKAFITGSADNHDGQTSQEKVSVFLGGSIHGRLIRSWWIEKGVTEFIPLIFPQDIHRILGRYPENKVRISGTLKRSCKEADGDIKRCVRELFLEFTRMLHSIVELAVNKEDELSIKFLRYQMSRLIEPSNQSVLVQYSFLPDEKTFYMMMSEDDDFNPDNLINIDKNH